MTNPLFFDIETHSASDRFRMSPEEFFRVGGVLRGSSYGVTRDWASMVAEVYASDLVVGHNVVSFDLPALDCDVLELTRDRRVLDTMIVDSLVDPPEPELAPAQAMRQKYSLQAASARYGVAGKSGDLRQAAQAHGGFGSIPTSDGDHLRYLRGDVEATRALYAAVHPRVGDLVGVDWGYVWREHRVHALTSNITSVGFDVDAGLLADRVAAGEQRQSELTKWLVESFDIPTTLPNGKPAKSPHATKAGKAALIAAFESVGVRESDLPRTPKDQVSLTADGLAAVAERFPAARELCEAVGALVGVRSVYGTAQRYLHADGRVHPDVTMFQASGRCSFTKPGLTVFGKRGERVRERDIFVAREGYLIFTADLSQVDARVVAVQSGDEEYKKLFAPGVDAHMEVARMVWGSLVDNDPKHYRTLAKVITHASSYGTGVPKLATMANTSEAEAQKVMDTLSERFPRLQEWKREIRREGEDVGVLDNGWGRKMIVNRERAYTQAPALIGQGGARDVLMEGLINLPLDVQRMIKAIVHDEVVIECPAEDVEELQRLVKESMSITWTPHAGGSPMQFDADVSSADSRWSGCY